MAILKKDTIELLAPAKDLDCGKAAVDCGADAVYIGGPAFGARAGAANTIADIEALTAYAHRFYVRVYAALNTILADDEIDAAVDLIRQYHAVGVDGVLIQDMGLLECDLPPIPLIASTQTENTAPEKISFLRAAGFERAVLARELSLDEIRACHEAQPDIELECFLHGAICVGVSGQCYLSYSMGGRSGNRGECAQPCRKHYTLTDELGTVIMAGYPLSPADMNRASHIEALIDSGITSFKIEGRLKDRNYVANVTAYHRTEIDAVLAKKGLSRSSSGRSSVSFTPDIHKTFNRGYTDHFMKGKRSRSGSIRTPKMIGELVGTATVVSGSSVTLSHAADLSPGDGISFFIGDTLSGTSVEAVQGATLRVGQEHGIMTGMEIYRNRDHRFMTSLSKSRNERAITVTMTLERTADGVVLTVTDEDGNAVSYRWNGAAANAEKKDEAAATIRRQLMKTGGSGFTCTAADVKGDIFLPVSAVNGIRRDALALLAAEREKNRPRPTSVRTVNAAPYITAALDFTGNVHNRKADGFYRRHGVTDIERSAESGLRMEHRRVMRTRFCIRHELDLCPGANAAPLFLTDDDGRRLRADFDCTRCGMDIIKLPERR